MACEQCSLGLYKLFTIFSDNNKLLTFLETHNLIKLTKKCGECDNVIQLNENNVFRCDKTVTSNTCGGKANYIPQRNKWRKFNFFDVKPYMDSSNFEEAEALNSDTITATSSGRGTIYIGTSKGNIVAINRQMQLFSFNAHESEVNIISADDNSNFMITVEGTKSKCVSTVKIWSLDRLTSHGTPCCIRTITNDIRSVSDSTSSSENIPIVTAVSYLCSISLLALGFSDGSISLYKDALRERGSKIVKLSSKLNGSITNLHLRPSQKIINLFATTERNIHSISFSSNNRESVIEFHKGGCLRGCSALSDSKHEYELLVARDDAIYGYTTDSRASCYVFEGKKLSLSWFRGYFVVVTEDEIRSNKRFVLTIHDPVNKLVTLSTEIENFRGVVSEWGGLYVITSTPALFHISEIDLPSKLELLFKKNQFDVAISIAKMQYCDQEEVAEILKQYGDWLYDKGNSSAAMEQYIKTIPHLEPSYVIKKFLDTQHIDNLTIYLKALHVSGNATSDHTTLMLNCYTRLEDSKELDNFIIGNDIDCDVEVAVKVCRGAGYYSHALSLAAKYNLHHYYLSILINDQKDYEAALKYIWTLSRTDAKECILLYGSSLMKHNPEDLIKLLIQLCTNYQFNRAHCNENFIANEDSTKLTLENPEDFEHLLIGHSEVAIAFLEQVMSVRNISSQLTTTLLSELLHQYSLAPEGHGQIVIEEKILKLLRSDTVEYDHDQTLLMCDKYHFIAGKLIIWEQAGMYEDLLEWHSHCGDYKSLVEVCQRHANHNQQLWASALKLMTRETSPNPPDVALFNCVLNKIDELQLLAPLEVADCITSSPHLTLGQVKNYIQRMIASQTAALSNEVSMFETQNELLSHTKDTIDSVASDTIYFTNTKCSICNSNLELPSTHFLCRHSYHKHCLESYSENDECPICLPENQKIRQVVSSRGHILSRSTVLQEELDKSSDCFSVIADYIGHGVFSNDFAITMSTILNEESKTPVGREKEIYSAKQERVLTFDNKLIGRSQENIKFSQPSTSYNKSSPVLSKAVHSPVLPSSVPLNDHIIKTPYRLEKEESSCSSENLVSHNVQKVFQQKSKLPDNPFEKPYAGHNPFEEEFENEDIGTNPFNDSYDESKNPFAEDDSVKSNNLNQQMHSSVRRVDNPFDEQDYDAALNPFESS